MKVKVFAPQLCLTLCDPKDCSMPGFPVHHQLLEPTQTHVHCIGDAIQPSHPLSDLQQSAEPAATQASQLNVHSHHEWLGLGLACYSALLH